MSPRVSVVVVNHRSAGEAAGCVASLREAFAAEAVDGEIVLVDCGSGEEERRVLAGLGADAEVFLDENRGYSGGANAGLERARSPAVVVSNADVAYLPGAVTALLDAIASPRVGAAAPLCFWDAERRLRLPADSASDFFGQMGLSRFAPFARRTLRLWEDGGDAKHLPGAVLATRREVLDRVGRFDEAFLFEYEETEWEDRVREAGLALRFEPRARVRHLFGRSAARNPDTERRRQVSRNLYRERRYGRIGRALLERQSSRPERRPPAAPLSQPAVAARAGAWVAVSTNASLVPFAGCPLDADFRLPGDVLASLRPGPVYLRVFRAADGRPLETFVWEKS
ncbi:MAG TPA: glycosyltransferase family 2 protein [Thermoanaerobaculia bacterium]|nr:glycosyltransferase family 2 protein [Thermoanaerobaculia bacterium]